MSNTRFQTLDAIRGLAALAVIPRHTAIFGDAASNLHSYLAVDLFFMLSGFVIAHSYDARLASGLMSGARFMLARLIRLYPMFLLAALFATAMALTRPPDEPNAVARWSSAGGNIEVLRSAVLTLMFLPSRLGDSVLLFPLNTAFWSLFFELLVNLLYALGRRWLSFARLVALIALLALAIGFIGLRRNGVEVGWAWGYVSLACGLVRACYGFGVGLLLYRLHERLPSRVSNAGSLVLIGAAMLPLVLPAVEAGNGLVDDISVLLVFPLAILLGANVQAGPRLQRVYALLGLLSYPVYVLHVPLAMLLEREYLTITGTRLQTHAPWAGLAMLALLLTLAYALARCYETPLRRWLSRRLQPPGAAPIASPG